MNFFHSITFRFTVWYLLVLALLLIALSIGVYGYFSRSLTQNLDDSLELRTTQLQSIRGVLESIGQGSFQEELGEVVVFYIKTDKAITYVSTREIKDPLKDTTDQVEKALQGEAQFVTVETEALGKLRFHVIPFTHEGNAMIPTAWGLQPRMVRFDSAAVAVGRSTTDIDEALQRLRRVLMLAIPFTLVIAGAGGIFLARRALKPVDQITQTAREIEEKDLSQRIPINTKDELGRLSSTLNQMIERLEMAFNRQKQFTGDASHELRTPLAVIEAEATLALQKDRTKAEYRQSLETVAQESSHMSAIISKLLALARADAGVDHVSLSPFDLGALVEEIAPDANILCHDKGLTFKLGTVDHVLIKGDKDKLRELVLNLVDNAIRYNREAGSVSLSLVEDTKRAIITVEDTGIGIPPQEIEKIFDRFYRVDKARSRAEGGSGLGLAICKHIVEAHSGTITVESEPERGSLFKVFLPTNTL